MADRKAIIDLDAKIQTMKLLTVDKNFLEARVKEVVDYAVDKAEFDKELKSLKENAADKAAIELVGLQVKELKESAASKEELDALQATMKKLKATTINGFSVFKMQFQTLLKSQEGNAKHEENQAPVVG